MVVIFHRGAQISARHLFLTLGDWLIIVAALMVSRIPTYAFKRVRIPNLLVVPLLLLAGIVAAGLATEP